MADERALAARLRRQELMATLGVLSGDPVLGTLGQRGFAQVEKGRDRLAQARRDARKFTALGQGFYLQGGEVKQIPGWEEAQQRQADRALKKSLAVAEAQRKMRFEDWYAQKQAELDMPTRSQATTARETEGFLPGFKDLAATLTQIGEIPKAPEVAARTARSSPIGGEEAAAAIERQWMTEDQVDWLARGRQREQDITRLASGLAVTGFELENLKKWSPWAGGLTNRERIKRIQNIHNAFGRKAASIMNQPWEDVKYTQEFLGVGPGGIEYQGEERTAPERPEGLTDEEWNAWKEIEGYQ